MTDTKEQRSAEERARDRYPRKYPHDLRDLLTEEERADDFAAVSMRVGYLDCLEEVAEPLELEVARLKALVGEAKTQLQTLVDNPPSNNTTYTHMPTIMAKAFLTKLSKEGA